MFNQVREAAVALLVEIEHLSIFRGSEGMLLFGTIYEMIGIALKHVASDRRDQAIRIVMVAGQTIPSAWPESAEREALQNSLSDFLLLLQEPSSDAVH
jgi:hypothetical protein